MTTLTSLQMVDQFIRNHSLSFIYISRADCGVCHVLLPQIENLLESYPEIYFGHIDASQLEEIAGKFSIFTVPVMILFIDGKEYLREARFVHIQQLKEKIDKVYRLIK